MVSLSRFDTMVLSATIVGTLLCLGMFKETYYKSLTDYMKGQIKGIVGFGLGCSSCSTFC